MASRNPFGLLNVRRDEEDEEVIVTPKTQTVNTGTQLFQQASQADKKKKKVRPEEKKRMEETRQEEDTEDGFEVVKKKVPQRNRAPQTEDAQVPQEKTKETHLKNKGAYHERNDKVPAGKRQFDRQSGTGRGREVAKGGAGGKHTWGNNPRNVARTEDEYNNDDRVFERVLNAKPRQPRETTTTEPQVVAEETKAEVVETPVVEPEAVAPVEEVVDRRRKRKGVEEVEVDKADLLERPENAVSLAEYMAQLKLKNATLNENKPRPVLHENASDLQLQTKTEDFTIGVGSGVAKSLKVRKEKKSENKDLIVEFKTEDGFERRTENRDNRDYNNRAGNNQTKKGKAFRFNNDDFPEL